VKQSKDPLSPQAPQAGRGSADAVRAFYGSHPYPAPIVNLDRHRDLYRNPDRRRALSLLLWPTEAPRADREILVAGCGTSQAAIHALREPDARVTAIDISETSLRYTRDLQQKRHMPLASSRLRRDCSMPRWSCCAEP
jgi:SAM-dependent methyltransferase